MAYQISRVSYFTAVVEDRPGEAVRVLSQVAGLGIHLLGFTGVPIAPFQVQLTFFPAEPALLQDKEQVLGFELDGPYAALLVQGDDVLGSVSTLHEKLYQIEVNVYACSGVASGNGRYGYILYINPRDYERAVAALEVD